MPTRGCSALGLAIFAGAVTSTCCTLAQSNGHLGVYADTTATEACTTVPVGSATILRVVATLEGSSSSGITGAEFRIEVENPNGWFLSYQSPAGSLPIGNPIDVAPLNQDDGSGINIAFSACRPPMVGRVLLGSIYAYNMSGSPTTLAVKRHSRPSNTAHACPLLVLCDAPYFSKVCTTANITTCQLMKASSASTCDCVHLFGLNSVVSAPQAPGSPMPDEVVAVPTLLNNPEPDIVGLIEPVAGKALGDTTWIADADWNFESGMQGWQRIDNRIRNDGSNYWYVSSEYNGLGNISGNALVLRRTAPCWSRPGYGNNWDYSIVLKYRGPEPRLRFNYLLGSEPQFDYLYIEADSAGVSESLVDYAARPNLVASDYRRQILLKDGYRIGESIDEALPTFEATGTTHEVYIRFSSDSKCSDEDGCPIQTIVAGVVVDGIEIFGGLSYTEQFEGSINPNISTMNSAPAAPFGEWARLFTHLTDNDKCTENTSNAWILTDPTATAFFPSMAFGPAAAVIRNWLDDVLVSPWVRVDDPTNGLILSFREFPGNFFQAGRIMRSYSLRGSYFLSSCVSNWSNDTDRFFGTWQDLSTFSWVTRTHDLSALAGASFDSVQVRFRVSDWQYIFGATAPQPHNPGPGPYIDRVRLGQIDLTGPVISEGQDSRSQAQDTFCDLGLPRPDLSCSELEPVGIHDTSRFSASVDLAASYNPYVRLADSIWVVVRNVRGAPQGITSVKFYGSIVAGPHAGKAPPPYIVNSNGFFEVTPDSSRNGLGALVADTYFVDLHDGYFRGGDVLHYYWWASDGSDGRTSNPPGISLPELVTSDSVATLYTGGLLEVSFLPEITWDPTYVAAIQADDHGDVAPTTAQLINSPQSNCILYVNKVNTRRRSGMANRTSFMYTLDKLGYSGRYDTYDVQGFGNTNNDLASRAHRGQIFGYPLVIHDAGSLSYGALPDQTDAATSKIAQDAWYSCWLGSALTGNFNHYAALWLIGDNIINTTRFNVLIDPRLGIEGTATPQYVPVGSYTLDGVASFTFRLSSSYTSVDFAGDSAGLNNYCPTARTYDTYAQTAPSAVVTHKFKPSIASPASNAIIMNKSDANNWNTIMMPFSWKDLVQLSGESNADATLAGKILTAIIPSPNCAAGVPSNIREEDRSQVGEIASSKLFSNFRNPARGSASFRFYLRQKADVQLTVYDVAGRRIRSLVQSTTDSGVHEVRWDGNNDAGAVMGSGVYILRFETLDIASSNKFVFIK